MSENGNVIIHKDQTMVGKKYPDEEVSEFVATSDHTTMSYKADHGTHLVVKRPINGTPWVSVAIVNDDEVVGELYRVRALILDMILLLLLLGIVAFIGFYYFNIKRISELTKQTKQLENGNFAANVKVTSKDEIGILGMRFNNMVRTIQEYINREYKLKIKQKETELKALQNQIDPHFLYNTLDMIRWTARIEQAQETGQLIERMSKMFRMNLNRGRAWVRLEEELSYIQNYLELQKKRLGERLSFTIYSEDEIKNAIVVKQLLQPLVENSIVHGLQNRKDTGNIIIRCYLHGQHIWLDVLDNGVGFGKTENKPSGGSGFALTNLRDRLYLAFGNGANVNILDYEDGAWVRVQIPFVTEEDKLRIKEESGEENVL
ncbi:histidine kinase [Radiobacillus deserti]|nr:histidine kinase [Radiobacillus deserti]